MRKITFILLFLAVAITSQSQQRRTVQAFVDGTHVAPATAVVVELVVKREVVTKGPYARYATQLLGTVAPLNDKVTYSIEAVSISGSNLGTLSSITKKGDNQKQGFKKGNQSFNNQFLDMSLTPIYSVTNGEKNTMTMATDAANAIFKIRSRRFDLVTGETGENVFGEGLKAAIKEMSRIEKEYTELFIGKHSVEYLTYQYEIIPEKDKQNYMVCRFDAETGIIDGLNINGTPVVLSTLDENRVVGQPVAQQKKGVAINGKKVIIADIALCKILLGEELLAEKRIPILQFGEMGEEQINNNDNAK